MAAFSLVVEDSSPLITYDPAGAWSDSSPDDTLAASYSGQSYHRTSTRGATATIEFYGTGITILGGMRTDYGRFAISVDGAMVVTDGNARGAQNLAKQTLGSVSGLRPGRHRAVLQNMDGAPIDIDSVTILDQVGPIGSKMETSVIDDTNALISYLPSPAAWGQNQLPLFHGGTIHFSQNPSAAASLRFRGDAIAVYGTASPDHADMRVTLDGEVAILKGGSNGGVNSLRPQILLFYKSGLGPGEHVFNLAAESPTADAPFVDIDTITLISGTTDGSSNPGVTSSRPVTPPQGSGTASGSNSGSRSGGISTPVLAGAIAAGIIGLLACLLVCLLAWRWRRRRRARFGAGDAGGDSQASNKGMLAMFRSASPTSPDLPMQQEPARAGVVISGPLENSVFVFPPKPKKDERLSIAPSYYNSPDSGHLSMNSNTSASPLIRPPLPPGARTVPARNFRGPTPTRGLPNSPAPRLARHSPSVSSTLSYDSAYSRAPSRGPTPFTTPPLPRAPRAFYSPSSSSTISRDWGNAERSPQRPIKRPTHIDFNELRM